MKNNEIRTQLGITQQEMAMLLGISLSRWAMYESGLRELPTPAVHFFAEFSKYTQSKPATAKTAQPDPIAQRQQLDQLLRENDYQQQKLKRETAAFQKKQQTLLKRDQLREFLQSRTSDAKTALAHAGVLSDKKYSSAQEIDERYLILERQQALLDFERQWLEDKRNGVK